ncbi:dimethylarginine dimethylaminohydrolase family protein [Nocardioides hungaricus]
MQGRVELATRHFNDPDELRSVWGEEWGATSDVGQLRRVMLRRPGSEFEALDVSQFDGALGAAFDPDGMGYWYGRDAPDLARMQAQHDNLVATLQGHGVQTEVLAPLPGKFTKSIYMRDPLVTTKGGAIITRLAPTMRRGEEAFVTRTVAALGMPILGTISGGGFVEGGSVIKLTPKVYLYGSGIRCNREGGDQLAEMLRWHGVELIQVPLSGYKLHLDGALAMVDVDRALLNPASTPHWLPDLMREHGVHPIWIDPDQSWAVNGLTLAPGHVLLSTTVEKTAEKLDSLGVKVDLIDYDAIQANGGGIHCSTQELLRDDV